MTARTFLVRGLLVGLLAGFAAFLVSYGVGESHVETAIAIEEANTGAATAPVDGAVVEDEHGGTEVSRANQSTWGLLTGNLAIGTVLGGFVALLAAAAVGRLGRLSAVQSTFAVAAIGFFSYSLVPFLKYPATPPAVGSGDTIGERTVYYFAYVLISVVAAIAALTVVRTAAASIGGLRASVAGVLGYVVVMSVASLLMPTVNEIGSFPADTLWYFRLASILTLVALWTVIGVGLALVVERLAAKDQARIDRLAFAASL